MIGDSDVLVMLLLLLPPHVGVASEHEDAQSALAMVLSEGKYPSERTVAVSFKNPSAVVNELIDV